MTPEQVETICKPLWAILVMLIGQTVFGLVCLSAILAELRRKR